MARKMIILGAGASYGSPDPQELLTRSISEYRPPLADQLVSADSQFALNTRTVNKLSNLPAIIKNYMSSGKSLEEAVSKIWSTHTDDGTRDQVVCFVFYLASLFIEISRQLRPCSSQYSTLCSSIQTSIQKKNSFTVVNYNYDTLFDEKCGIDFSKMDTSGGEPRADSLNGYINNPNLHLIKLHGSCNWWHFLSSSSGGKTYSTAYETLYKKNNPDLYQEIIGLALGNRQLPERDIWIYNNSECLSPNSSTKMFLAPVLCLPLSEKVDAYVCPEKHYEALQSDLDEVDQILIIGWSAGDTKLLKDISESIKRRGREITIYLALGSSGESYETVTKNIKQGCPEIKEGYIKCMNFGIENLAGSPEYLQFMD